MSEHSVVAEIIRLVNSGQPFTDIHVEQDAAMMWKTPSGWQETGFGATSIEDMEPVLSSLEREWRQAISRGAIDRPISLSNSRLRCNIFRMRGGERLAISIRKHPLEPFDLTQIGMPPQIVQTLNGAKGLIVVTGSTGAGKTTALAAMVAHINRTRAAHVVTIEQPIEYLHERRSAIVSQREVPTDVPTFSEGLREALRQKPDVIMIGEVRDRDTADTAFHAAESGHLVLASMHTNSTEGAINKLLSFFPANELAQRAATLSTTLIAVVCQALLPRRSGDGFVLASELLFNSSAQVSKLIADPSKIHLLRDVMRRGEDHVTRHMNTVLIELIRKGEVAKDAAIRASHAQLDLVDEIQRKAL